MGHARSAPRVSALELHPVRATPRDPMTTSVLVGDCRDVMATLDAGSVSSVVCDPPYGLKFMGKGWDHGVPGVQYWTETLRVMAPGAYLVAFGGTRTFHRLTCAIEDAGFEVQDCLSWLYGSGFPKHKSKLKPAWEPIILARKPAKFATLLNIDACRIDGVPRATHGDRNVRTSDNTGAAMGRGMPLREYPIPSGRWPANVVLDEEAAEVLDAQSGERRSPKPYVYAGKKSGGYSGSDIGQGIGHDREYGDAGGASRFYYTAKASRSERESGLEGMEQRRCGMMEDDAYPIRTGSGNLRDTRRTNHHPTVKPISLMRWLCRLITPPNGVILDPFCGSGTTGCAAVLEGFDFLGIDKDPEYVAIAQKRIAHWTPQPSLAIGA